MGLLHLAKGRNSITRMKICCLKKRSDAESFLTVRAPLFASTVKTGQDRLILCCAAFLTQFHDRLKEQKQDMLQTQP